MSPVRNIMKIFSCELRALFSNVVTGIITIGLALMPSLFTWYNVLSCWDVFDNTGELSVAVASDDTGYKSELFPLKVNVGEQVISALRANDQIHWVFTSSEDALDGTRSGRYYAAVVIPEGFSRAMLTFYQDEGEQAPLVYYTNEKKNAIAPKITSQGADNVSYQVNKVFAETLAEITLNIAQSVSQYMDDADVQSCIAALAADVDAVGDRIDQTANVLNLYADLVKSSQSVLESSADLVSQAQSSASEAADITDGGLEQVQDTLGTLDTALTTMETAIQSSIDSLDAIAGEVPRFDNLPDASAAATKLRQQADTLGVQIQGYEEMRTALMEDGEEKNAAEIVALDAAIAQMRLLQKSMNDTADDIEAGDVPLDPNLVILRVDLAKQALESLKALIQEDLRPRVEDLRSSALGLSALLTTSMDGLSDGVGAAQSGMGNAASELSDLIGKLHAISFELHGVSSRINEALSSDDFEQMRNLLSSDLDVLSRALAAPVAIERSALYEADNFGSSMTPLYASIGMFVGALLIMVVVKPRSSERVLSQAGAKRPLKPRHEFFGHFGICAFISFAQSSILALGNLFFLHVQVADPLLFLLCYWISSLTFTFFIYALVVSFANLGKAMAVILLIIQVTGCNGSYPLQLLPWFVQDISPFLPVTHVVSAMREAMFGTYGAVFWEQMALVAFWLLPALLLGLLLRKPFAAFMSWYVEKVESSKLMA